MWADLDSQDNPKLKKDDRIFVLKPIEGKATLTTTGLVDRNLFTGENNLHAIRNPMNSLWTMRYDAGIVPGPLKQTFTSWMMLEAFVRDYFKKRNIDVVEIRD